MNVENLEYKIAKIEDKFTFLDFFKHNFCTDYTLDGTIQLLPYDSSLSFYFEHSLKNGIPIKIYLKNKLCGLCINYFINYNVNNCSRKKLLYIHYIIIKRRYAHILSIYDQIIKSLCSFAGIDFYYYKHTVNRNNSEIINSIVSNPLKMYLVPINHFKLIQYGLIDKHIEPSYKYTIGQLKIVNNEPNIITKIFSKHIKKYSSRPIINKSVMGLFFTKNNISISDGIQFLCKIDIVKYIHKEKHTHIVLTTGILNILVDTDNKFTSNLGEICTILLKQGVDQLILREELGNFIFDKHEINNFEEYILSESIFCETEVEFFNF